MLIGIAAGAVALVSLIGGALVLCGFGAHVFQGRPATRDLAAGVICVVTAYAGGRLYWDLGAVLVDAFGPPGAWSDWYAVTGQLPNVVFGALFIVGLRYLLSVLWWLIPPDQRSDWSYLEAPFWPEGNLLTRLFQSMRARWRLRLLKLPNRQDAEDG